MDLGLQRTQTPETDAMGITARSLSATGQPATRLWTARGALVLACLLFLLNVAVYFNFSEDDPGISFRYAWNLAHSHGLVYNPGERVEGYSNLGYVVALATVFRAGLLADRLGVLLATKLVNSLLALGSRLPAAWP